ncbi:MAG: S-methyl-5-thioribose-1-phosphate isomerase [Bacillota bacterium]
MLKPITYFRTGSEATLRLLDQRALPSQTVYRDCRSAQEAAVAIKQMVVRGAPAIGITAAYALAVEAWSQLPNCPSPRDLLSLLEPAAQLLVQARPTAVNLSWAVARTMRTAANALQKAVQPIDIALAVEREAASIEQEDVQMNLRMAEHGAPLLPDQGGVLTHCNAGALATGGYGTALGVIRKAYHLGKKFTVYVDETRPLLQGARLTAWELIQDHIPVVLITDNAAGYLMKRGLVHAVIVGADRIAANGDVANKIGTYSLAVLCRAHNIPFFVAAPTSTIDLSTPSGEAIVVEERSPEEVTTIGGIHVAPEGVQALNPAFDVTPASLVSAIVTNRGVVRPPYEQALRGLLHLTT